MGDDRRPENETHEATPEDYLAGRPEATFEVDGWIRAGLLARYPVLRDECDDLCQVVHAKLLENLREGRFEGRSKFRTYVTGVVHYTAIDRIRKKYRRPLESDEAVEGTADPARGPYEAIAARDEARLLHRVLQDASETCRELWRLVFVERLGYDEIAERLGVPTGTVKSRMYHCRRKAAAAYARYRGPQRRADGTPVEPATAPDDSPARERGEP